MNYKKVKIKRKVNSIKLKHTLNFHSNQPKKNPKQEGILKKKNEDQSELVFVPEKQKKVLKDTNKKPFVPLYKN